nr:hypothetical protein [Bradyrhizobium sp. 195]
MNASPLRLPDAGSIEAVLADLDPASADDDLVPALARAFPGFQFSAARIDDDYWRDTRSVIRPDGTRIGELRPWMTAELAKDDGTIDALWRRLKETDLQITEWRGTSAFVFAPTGPGASRLCSDRARARNRMASRPDRQSELPPVWPRGTARSELAPH